MSTVHAFTRRPAAWKADTSAGVMREKWKSAPMRRAANRSIGGISPPAPRRNSTSLSGQMRRTRSQSVQWNEMKTARPSSPDFRTRATIFRIVRESNGPFSSTTGTRP